MVLHSSLTPESPEWINPNVTTNIPAKNKGNEPFENSPWLSQNNSKSC